MSRTTIKSVEARQIMSMRGHPGVEATVTTESGAKGTAVCTAGVSIGTHEVKFAYDGGTRWGGKGVLGAVHNVHKYIEPALVGLDCANQSLIDKTMLEIMPDAKINIGGNAIGAVSAAAVKAGAAGLDIPLYQHIGGVGAVYLPVPGAILGGGSNRYGSGQRSGGKPSYAMMCYGFDTFSEASYAAWDFDKAWRQLIRDKLGVEAHGGMSIPIFPKGSVDSDRVLWDLMADTIQKLGYQGKLGIQVDIAADTYYDKKDETYYGLLSAEPKKKDDLMKLYVEMVKQWPFVIIEDPFHEDDYDSHAELVKLVDIQITGDDLFTTNPERVAYGISKGAATAVLLKVYQVGTITEALDMVHLAYWNGYGVMPCESRGESTDIADYCVGINAGTVREGGIGETGNRFLAIEAELGNRAKFSGPKGIKGRRFQGK